MRPNFIMLVGLPGSGKSTFRAKFDAYVQLSSDDIIEEIARRNSTTYDAAWATSIDTATKLLNVRLSEALRDRKSIIFDRTNLTTASRRKVMSQVPKDYIRTAVYFEIDEALRQERMAARVGKAIPASADAQMRQWYIRPTFEESYDYIIDGVACQHVEQVIAA